MKNENDDLANQPLSDDPEENLRMENELLRLKLQAEFGGESHNAGNLPPDIENEFLKHVFAFEQNHARSKRVKIYDFLGRPEFKKINGLTDELIEPALHEVTKLLLKKNIMVHFGDEYDNRTRYRFITEELFEKETDDFMIPGLTVNFDYEEFHPNHKKDIENRALEFIDGWFKQSFSDRSWELGSEFVLPDRTLLSKADILVRLENIFAAYTRFADEKFVIKDIGFQLQDGSGLGHAEGGVKYNAVLESGETITLQGPFKLYMSLDNGWWSIFHIIFPGFKY